MNSADQAPLSGAGAPSPHALHHLGLASAVGLNWREVWLVYSRELRGALRERAIVVNSILIPVLLYPFLLWAAFTGILFVTGQTEGFSSRVVVTGWPKAHPKLQVDLQRNEQIELLEPDDPPAVLGSGEVRGVADVSHGHARLQTAARENKRQRSVLSWQCSSCPSLRWSSTQRL